VGAMVRIGTMAFDVYNTPTKENPVPKMIDPVTALNTLPDAVVNSHRLNPHEIANRLQIWKKPTITIAPAQEWLDSYLIAKVAMKSVPSDWKDAVQHPSILANNNHYKNNRNSLQDRKGGLLGSGGNGNNQGNSKTLNRLLTSQNPNAKHIATSHISNHPAGANGAKNHRQTSRCSRFEDVCFSTLNPSYLPPEMKWSIPDISSDIELILGTWFRSHS
jgi:hypothetical protein